jgi:ubiquinone biosynthesis protein UbiJ
LLIGATAVPRQANGVYEVRVDDEAVRVDVTGGQVHAAPDSEPDTTIELTRPGLRALILGARSSDIEEAGDLSIHGNRRRAHALVNAMTGPPLLAGLRSQLQGGGG